MKRARPIEQHAVSGVRPPLQDDRLLIFMLDLVLVNSRLFSAYRLLFLFMRMVLIYIYDGINNKLVLSSLRYCFNVCKESHSSVNPMSCHL